MVTATPGDPIASPTVLYALYSFILVLNALCLGFDIMQTRSVNRYTGIYGSEIGNYGSGVCKGY
jgi:hypothetical protein